MTFCFFMLSFLCIRMLGTVPSMINIPRSIASVSISLSTPIFSVKAPRKNLCAKIPVRVPRNNPSAKIPVRVPRNNPSAKIPVRGLMENSRTNTALLLQ